MSLGDPLQTDVIGDRIEAFSWREQKGLNAQGDVIQMHSSVRS